MTNEYNPDGKEIRFIDSHYKDLFHIPDGSCVQIHYPDEMVVKPCTFIDEYHTQIGYNVFHICQFAEIMERNGASYMPEPEIMGDEAAWKVGKDRILAVQTCEDGYDYTLLDENYNEIDGGQVDNPELSMLEVRRDILESFGLERRELRAMFYEDVMEQAFEVGRQAVVVNDPIAELAFKLDRFAEKAKDRVMGMVELRGIVNELIEYQLEDYPDEMITQKQAELNDAYDAFAAKNGLINNRANGQAFADDSSYYLLCSLENVDEDGNLKSKADMFTKRTIKPERRVTSVDTPSEALAISIGERGKVDLPFMAQLLGTPGEYDAIQAELRGVIFKDPMAPDAVEVGWQTADDYLSGDVRSKLRVAQMAADRDSSFHINVEALQKAQPKDLDASEIDVRLGATWIDADYIQQFMEETFETPYYLRRSIEVKFSELTAEWRINGKSCRIN